VGGWLLVPTALIAFAPAPLAILGAAALAYVVLLLPVLQLHFAAHDRVARMLDADAARALFSRAPAAWALAQILTLTSALPLYLLKIEIVPRDALWLPAVLFVAFIFPAKIACAWAYHRAQRRSEAAHPALRWSCRVLTLPAAAGYVAVVFLSQYTGWHGALGMFEHHAFLLPVPF
jgi:hypothetical protein